MTQTKGQGPELQYLLKVKQDLSYVLLLFQHATLNAK